MLPNLFTLSLQYYVEKQGCLLKMSNKYLVLLSNFKLWPFYRLVFKKILGIFLAICIVFRKQFAFYSVLFQLIENTYWKCFEFLKTIPRRHHNIKSMRLISIYDFQKIDIVSDWPLASWIVLQLYTTILLKADTFPCSFPGEYFVKAWMAGWLLYAWNWGKKPL